MAKTKFKTIPPESVRADREPVDSQFQKLDLWIQSGLDFCTTCFAEKLVVVAGLYTASSYIKCGQCGTRQE